MLAARLRSWGYDPVSATNGNEAWEKLQRERLNLVLSDCMMPVVDGLELCRRVRSADLDRYVYIILCTGKNDREDLIAGLEAGADDFLSKPVDFDELRVALRGGSRVLELESRLHQKNRELSDANTRLEQAYATMQRDLEAAATLQEELLPRDRHTLSGLEVDWVFMPASFVAGDIFDFFPLDERRLAFYLLDVSGHGVSSALLSVSISQSLLNAHREGSLTVPESGEIVPPEEVIGRLNLQFQNIGDMYFTMIYGVVDMETREVRLSQAGHPNPISVSGEGSVLVHTNGGFPVGMIAPMEYHSYGVPLGCSGRLVLYSDGITECKGPDGEAFGEERLVNFLKENHRTPLSATLCRLRDLVREWRGVEEAFEDDISVLAFEANAGIQREVA